jgi:hypothetical protein
LTPSLSRSFKPSVTAAEALAVEQLGLADYQAQAHLHLPPAVIPPAPPAASVADWWALMQHYNAPTRLLDWTLSPYVAAYFAVECEFGRDGAIFIVQHHTIKHQLREHIDPQPITHHLLNDPASPDAVVVWRPARSSERLVAQQGWFTFGTNILTDQDELIRQSGAVARQSDPKTLFIEKWVVPSAMKLEFLRRLRRMNIAAHSLFPGIDGLGRSIAEAARLTSAL